MAQALRAELRALGGAPEEGLERLTTGLSALDELLGGGLARGRVCGWAGRPGAGLASVLRAATSAALAAGHQVLIVDAGRSLDAADWARVPGCDRLLVARPEGGAEAVWAAEVAARSGAFALVGLCLGEGELSRAGLRRASPRLRVAAREGEAALVVLGEAADLVASSALSVRPARFDPRRCEWTVALTRVRGGAPRAVEVAFDVSHRLVAPRLPEHPLVPDRRPRPTRSAREGFERDPGDRGRQG